MSVLSDKLKNGVVVDKDMVVVCYDFDGNINSIEKIEYMSNNEYQTFLLKQKNEFEKKSLEWREEEKKIDKELAIKEESDKKQKVLSAFDRWYRDVTNGIVMFDNSMYEDVINWYRTFLEDNNIEVHNELLKYL